ncbi:MAG: hypothetical protein DI585_01690 [Pseudomonas fluorescens]|nr:MAG: hypothetical protein DI585_01690 [Pseudomonas fluorescens]
MRTILLSYFFPDLRKFEHTPNFLQMRHHATMSIHMLISSTLTTLIFLVLATAGLILGMVRNLPPTFYAAAALAILGALTALTTLYILHRLYRSRAEGLTT